MPRSKKKPSLESKEDRLRSFFVGLTAKVIHDYKYESIGKASAQAEKLVEEDWPFLTAMLDKAFSEWNATPHGLFLVTKPLTHRLIYDKTFNRTGEKLYKAGQATIILIDSAMAKITFSNKEFHHGHIHGDTIGCRGFFQGKDGFENNLIEHGPSNLLATILTFCVTSRYGTRGQRVTA